MHQDQLILILDHILEQIDYRIQIKNAHFEESLQSGETFDCELISFSVASLHQKHLTLLGEWPVSFLLSISLIPSQEIKQPLLNASLQFELLQTQQVRNVHLQIYFNLTISAI